MEPQEHCRPPTPEFCHGQERVNAAFSMRDRIMHEVDSRVPTSHQRGTNRPRSKLPADASSSRPFLHRISSGPRPVHSSRLMTHISDAADCKIFLLELLGVCSTTTLLNRPDNICSTSATECQPLLDGAQSSAQCGAQGSAQSGAHSTVEKMADGCTCWIAEGVVKRERRTWLADSLSPAEHTRYCDTTSTTPLFSLEGTPCFRRAGSSVCGSGPTCQGRNTAICAANLGFVSCR